MRGDITILLSIYEGRRFLADQLESIRQQTCEGWQLRWREDGSLHQSRDIVDAFARSLPAGQCAPLSDDNVHLGIAGSFLTLLRAHIEHAPDDLVAFADQDDVWLPEKLVRGVDALRQVPRDVPALYCARQMLVDEKLRTLGPSPHLRRPPTLPTALAQNIATGCTVMLNATAARLIASVAHPAGTLHDWWSYLVVTAAGGEILVDAIPVVLYRQHGGNAVGARFNTLQRGAGALQRGPSEFMTLLRRHVAALRATGDMLSRSAMERLAEIEAALNGNLTERLRLLRNPAFGRQTWSETAVFDLWLLIG